LLLQEYGRPRYRFFAGARRDAVSTGRQATRRRQATDRR
jgi:hypothetical protein